ncbi:MAG: hypothetical protein FWC03_00415 [Treponema sp.]|nr:hypothetical protein [Treponema sp.]
MSALRIINSSFYQSMIHAMMETNVFVFAASKGNELSYESERWGGGHGAFTCNILNALSGG